ncbi:antA/AntB antirepressor family protein [Morganella sp. GD04133]|uniref:antA/AntB antirepressor family protein n=1 Tax=Morganella sp. GD04133 TaxID=2975435 RepID=UPI0032603226
MKKINALTGSGQTHPENGLTNTFDNLIPVVNNNIDGKEIQTVSSRKLHSFLKVGRDYTSWIKGRIKQYGFVENIDYIVVENLSAPKRGSAKFRQQIEHDYIVSLNMGKELSMVERNSRLLAKEKRQRAGCLNSILYGLTIFKRVSY